VGRVVVELTDAPENSEVALNGKPIPIDRLGTPVAVMSGEVEISAQAPGRKPARIEVKVGAGEERAVSITLEPEERAPGAPTTPPEPSKPEPVTVESSGGGLRVAGFVAAGVGAAGLVVFAIAGSMASSKFDTLESECGGRRCADPKYAEIVDDGKRFDTIANVGLAIGAVGLLGGGTLILFGGPTSRPAERATMSVGPSGFRVSYEGRF
jgi:hypothetical protein